VFPEGLRSCCAASVISLKGCMTGVGAGAPELYIACRNVATAGVVPLMPLLERKSSQVNAVGPHFLSFNVFGMAPVKKL
jgi:hypothetical protein